MTMKLTKAAALEQARQRLDKYDFNVFQYLQTILRDHPTDDQVEACSKMHKDLDRFGHLTISYMVDDPDEFLPGPRLKTSASDIIRHRKLNCVIETVVQPKDLSELPRPILKAYMKLADWDPEVRKAYMLVLGEIYGAYLDGVEPLTVAELLLESSEHSGFSGEASAKILNHAASVEVEDDPDYVFPLAPFLDTLKPEVRKALLHSLPVTLTDAEALKLSRDIQEQRPLKFKPSYQKMPVMSPSGITAFDKLSTDEKLTWLAKEAGKVVTTKWGMLTLLSRLPARHLFLIYSAVEPDVKRFFNRKEQAGVEGLRSEP
jgi:hypothetical protein